MFLVKEISFHLLFERCSKTLPKIAWPCLHDLRVLAQCQIRLDC